MTEKKVKDRADTSMRSEGFDIHSIRCSAVTTVILCVDRDRMTELFMYAGVGISYGCENCLVVIRHKCHVLSKFSKRQAYLQFLSSGCG